MQAGGDQEGASGDSNNVVFKSPRRTVDLQGLNRMSRRETHHTTSPFNLVSRVPMGLIKSVLDCWNGYHSLP